MEHPKTAQYGFTLIEIMISIAIIAVLLALSSVNLGKGETAVNVATATDSLLADIKSQQLLAMAGDIGSMSAAQPHGIFIEPKQYTLYSGASYRSSDSDNFVIPAPSSITLSSSLPSGKLQFETGDGAIQGFINGQNTITVSGTGGANTITIDRFGATTIN